MTKQTFFKHLAALAYTATGKNRFKVDRKTGAIRTKSKHGGTICLCPIEEVAQSLDIPLPAQPLNFQDKATWAGYYSQAADALGLDRAFVDDFIEAVDGPVAVLRHDDANPNYFDDESRRDFRRSVALRTKMFGLLGLNEARL